MVQVSVHSHSQLPRISRELLQPHLLGESVQGHPLVLTKFKVSLNSETLSEMKEVNQNQSFSLTSVASLTHLPVYYIYIVISLLEPRLLLIELIEDFGAFIRLSSKYL